MRTFWRESQWRARALMLLILDALAMAASSFLAVMVRFEFEYSTVQPEFLETIYHYLPINIICTVIIFWLFHLYSSLWKYASVSEFMNVVFAVVISSLVNGILMNILDYPITRSFPFLYMIFLGVFVFGLRFAYRFLRHIRNWKENIEFGKPANVMVIGAGDAGAAIIKEMRLSKFSVNRVRCVIDDNPKKQGQYIQGCPVVGDHTQILAFVERFHITKIVIAIPTASKKEIKELVDICKETECEVRILPGTYQLLNGEVSVSQLREVGIEDLLGRDPIQVDLDSVLGYVKDKVVMVTGGGGSIGSEICRQLASHGVKQLIVIDIYENNAYEIQQELKRKYPDLDLVVLIASVRNTHRMNTIMEKYHPEVIYHAAAHKHVPLMEDSPNEAIKNNVMGTYKTAKAAAEHGVKRFVLISTDKAVNPTNIMGASKRLCEMVVQMMDRKCPDTEFVAVRFGNVLGSNGSVIPLFKKQIAEGGPVTVTHPEIIRYFMTIPEAVSLVLQAGGYAKGGEIFILDMGEPVKIAELAANLIRLSGFKVGEDIEIQYTGLRPGEKLYEELLMAEEGMQDTDNKRIHIGKPIEMDDVWFEQKLDELDKASRQETDEMKNIVAEIVPTYHPK